MRCHQHNEILTMLLNAIVFYIFHILLCQRVFANAENVVNTKIRQIIACKNESTETETGRFNWYWSNNNNYTISKPDICWINDQIVLRQCNTTIGQWIPEHVDCEAWRNDNVKCPQDLIEIKWRNRYACLKMSKEPQMYNEKYCYGSDYVLKPRDLTDRNLREIFLQRNITEFWLPINFYNNKSSNPLVIRLPGRQWNEFYNEHLNSNDMNNALCFAISLQKETNVNGIIKTVNCNQTFHSVCVFKEHLVTTAGCPRRFGALTYKPTECFGILPYYYNSFNDHFHKVTIEEYYEKQTTIWIVFNKRRVRIRRYLQLADYSDKSRQLPKNLTWVLDRVGIPQITSQSDKFPQLFALNVTRKRENIQMKLNVKGNSLILIVYNIYYLWSNEDDYRMGIYCYTTNEYGATIRIRLRKIWTSDFRDRMIYKYKLKSYDPNIYWCEGHSIFNFEFILSNKVVAAKANLPRRHNFAITLNYHFKNATSSNYIRNRRQQSNNIRNDLTAVWKKCQTSICENLKIHNVRIMDIIELTWNDIQYLCHITVSTKNSFISNSTELNGKRMSQKESPIPTTMRAHDVFEAEVAKYLYEIIVILMKMWQPKQLESIRSTKFCFNDYLWHTVRIGQLSTLSTFCLQKNGLPPIRKCLGTFLDGAYWGDSSQLENTCITEVETNLITRKLYNIDKNLNNEKLVNDLTNIRQLLKWNVLNLIPADLYYLSNILKYTLNILIETNDNDNYNGNGNQQGELSNEKRLKIIANVLQIQNDLLKAEERVFRLIALLNSTNVILSVFETIIDEIFVEISATEWSLFNQFNEYVYNNNYNDNKDDDAINITVYHDVGILVYAASNFVTFIIDPQVANITGIAIYFNDCHNTTDGLLFGSFPNECYRYIKNDQNLEELIDDVNIMIATYVPENLWQRLDEIAIKANRTDVLQTDPKIVIKIYGNTKLFQENRHETMRILNGKVLSISIPGHDENLPGILPIIFNIQQQQQCDALNNIENMIEPNHECTYWNFNEWSTDGVTLMAKSNFNNSTILCGATHLTPFAYLLGAQYRVSAEFVIHQKALDFITILGCCLSLFGISGLFITACIFRSWRNKANSIVLLQLSAATALQMILFCFINTKANIQQLISNGIYSSCIAIGALLHYFVLVQFIWMIIIAYLQFKRYVQVFGNTRPKRFFIKSTLLGWCLPLIPVIVCLIFDSGSYIPLQGNDDDNDNDYDNDDNLICYPTGYSLYYGIILPTATIVLINLIIFIIIVYNIMRNPIGSTTRHFYQMKKTLILSQLRLYTLLFFLLGFTWIFGFMAATNVGLIFSYLFCLTATLQGLVLFIYFIIMDPITRRMWWKYLSILCGLHGSNYTIDSSTSPKHTTQSFTG